jgi:hypothetical protein
MIVVIFDDLQTDGERALRAAGLDDEVLSHRQKLQAVVEGELQACVERAIGRRVIAVLSATRLEPDLSGEIFLLASEGSEPHDEHERELFESARRAGDRARELREQTQALDAQALLTRRRAEQHLLTRRNKPDHTLPPS